MPPKGPTLKTIAKQLAKVGAKIRDGTHAQTCGKIWDYIQDEAHETEAAMILQIIEQDYIRLILGLQENQDRPLSPGYNSMGNLPVWFYEAAATLDLKIAFLTNQAVLSTIKKHDRGFYKHLFLLRTCWDPKKSVVKGVLPSVLTEMTKMRMRAVGDRTLFLAVDEDGEIDWMKSGPYEVVLQCEEKMVKVTHRFHKLTVQILVVFGLRIVLKRGGSAKNKLPRIVKSRTLLINQSF